jgi:hypothetical protein
VTVIGVVAVIYGSPNNNNPIAAKNFQSKLDGLSILAPSTSTTLTFSEEELSSYFHLVVERKGLSGLVSDGQVRILDSGQVVVAGRADRLGGLPFAATFDWQTNAPHQTLRLAGAWLDVVPLGNSPLGWVPVPTAALGWVQDSVNSLFGNVVVAGFAPQPQDKTWVARVVVQ